MKTKVCRIEPDALDILSKHSNNKGTISERVRAMDRKIRDNEMSPVMSDPKSNWIPGANLTDGMSPEYWKRLKKEVDACIESAKRY